MKKKLVPVLIIIFLSLFIIPMHASASTSGSTRMTVNLVKDKQPYKFQQIRAYNYQMAYETLISGKIPDKIKSASYWKNLQAKYPGMSNGIVLPGNLVIADGVKNSSQDARKMIQFLFLQGPNFDEFSLLQVLNDSGLPGVSPDGLSNQFNFINFTNKQGISEDTMSTGMTLFVSAEPDGTTYLLGIINVTSNMHQLSFDATNKEINYPQPPKSTEPTPQSPESSLPQPQKVSKFRILLPIAGIVFGMLVIGGVLVLRKTKEAA